MTTRPSDAWGDMITVQLSEDEETAYDDGYDAGYEDGRKAGLVEVVGVVTALFVAEVDGDVEDEA